MISVGICFGILVLAVLIYLSRDNTQWKEMHTGLKGYHATANDHAKTSKEVQASLLDFKIKFNDRMKENEALREQIAQLHEHIARYQDTVRLFEMKLTLIGDKVQGYRIELPKEIAITLTKDVTSATTSRNYKKESPVTVKNSKVRRTKMASKTSRRS